MSSHHRAVACLTCVGLVTAGAAAWCQQPGALAPAETQQRLKILGRELSDAMAAADLEAIEAVVAEVRDALGPYAGVPESPERYQTPVNTAVPSLETVRAAWERSYREALEGEGSRNPIADKNQLELRVPAYIAIACLAAVDAGLDGRDGYLLRAREELDYLIERQDTSGLFPYPAKPGGRSPANVRAQVERIRKEHPDSVRNGYIYLDDPGMQFDVGCCGVALCEGYRVMRDPKYLEAAERAGLWAMNIGLSPNWNYNAFSVWLLANLHQVTGKDMYFFAALHKAKYGVLPGLMETGRWVDQHNAKQSYHFIMVRALSDLVYYMPASYPDRPWIEEKLALAVDSRVDDILRDGVSNTESASWGLTLAVHHQGKEERRVQALSAIINAVLAHSDGLSPITLPLYLRYRVAAMDPNASQESQDDSVNASIALFDSGSWRGRMPPERRQAINELGARLKQAMNADDDAAVQASVEAITEAHGEFAGVPETLPDYESPINDATPDFDSVAMLWQRSFERMKGRNAFETAPPPDGKTQSGNRLRVSLRHCRAYLQSYNAGLDPQKEFLAYARQGFDYMLKTQASNGVFGYPYDPKGGGLKSMGVRIVEQGRARGVKMVEKGWVIDDLGDGGLQFDNGVVGLGLLYAYAVTEDERYLDAARRAGEWAIPRPLVLNWNYNSFSGWLLARLYRVTQEQRYLDEAMTKFKYGVLPGQMANGRWFDQHNAKIQYHSTMLRSLVEFYLALRQAEDPYAEFVKARTLRGLDNLAQQITAYGASNIHEMLSTDALCAGLLAFGGRAQWIRALNININCVCDVALPALEARNYPMTETTVHYLLYRAVKAGNGTAVEMNLGLGARAE